MSYNRSVVVFCFSILLVFAAGTKSSADTNNKLAWLSLLLGNSQTATTPGQTTTSTLNDTGQTWSGNYESGNNATCIHSTSPDGDNHYLAQDCSHGRDASNNDDSDGHAGFSFTKLDANGNSLSASAASWSCVKDNVTGLIWEVKTDDGGLHDKDDTYNWYNTNPNTNGGANGYADDDGDICYGYNSGDSSTFCNTQAFVARVNAAGLCGASDWRMPTVGELEGIVSFDRTDPAIDTDYFPRQTSSYVWSGSASAYFPDYAWYVNFYFGNSGSHGYRDGHGRVRLVRDGQ